MIFCPTFIYFANFNENSKGLYSLTPFFSGKNWMVVETDVCVSVSRNKGWEDVSLESPFTGESFVPGFYDCVL